MAEEERDSATVSGLGAGADDVRTHRGTAARHFGSGGGEQVGGAWFERAEDRRLLRELHGYEGDRGQGAEAARSVSARDCGDSRRRITAGNRSAIAGAGN